MATEAVREIKYDIPTLHRFKLDEYGARDAATSPMMFEERPVSVKPYATRYTSNYTRMNEWMQYGPTHGRAKTATAIPTKLTDENWKAMRAGGYDGPRPQSEDFRRSYSQLVEKNHIQGPMFGFPKKREGRHGSSWRNTKEVIGMGPGRLMWIDGVVSLYDQTMYNSLRPSRSENRRNQNPIASTPQFALNRHDVSSYRRRDNLQKEKANHKPWYTNNNPQPLPYISERGRPVSQISGVKNKGFYNMHGNKH